MPFSISSFETHGPTKLSLGTCATNFAYYSIMISLFCCPNSLVSRRRMLSVVYMYYMHSDFSFDMLFAMVYAKLLKIVLSQLAQNGMFSSSKVIDISRSSKIQCKMTPHLKINFTIYRKTVKYFMLSSQFAQ